MGERRRRGRRMGEGGVTRRWRGKEDGQKEEEVEENGGRRRNEEGK